MRFVRAEGDIRVTDTGAEVRARKAWGNKSRAPAEAICQARIPVDNLNEFFLISGESRRHVNRRRQSLVWCRQADATHQPDVARVCLAVVQGQRAACRHLCPVPVHVASAQWSGATRSPLSTYAA